MPKQLFFLIEHNLWPLQMILRGKRCSAFLQYDEEIGLSQNSKDIEIIKKIAQQKEDLRIDRIIITRDNRDFITYLGFYNIKVIVLLDKTDRYALYDLGLNKLAEEIIAKAIEILKITPEQYINYIECSKYYKK